MCIERSDSVGGCTPIPGGAISCYTLTFLRLGVPPEATALSAAANVIFDFTATAGLLYDLLVQLTHSAKQLDMPDEGILHRAD